MQQMHQPQQAGWAGNGWNGQNQNAAMSSVYPPHPQGYSGAHSTNAAVDDLISVVQRETDDIDEIIRMAEAGIKPPKKGEAPPAAALAPTPGLAQTLTPVVAPTSEPSATTVESSAEKTEVEKKSKKGMKMVYDDNEVSPEEKMALMPRYAFVQEEMSEMVVGEGNTQLAVAVDA